MMARFWCWLLGHDVQFIRETRMGAPGLWRLQYTCTRCPHTVYCYEMDPEG